MNKQVLNEFKTELEKYISFKSVSTNAAFLPEINKTASWLSDMFQKHGFKVELLKDKRCNPVVLASYCPDKSKETVLLYGHYDVQPAKQTDGWSSDPFTIVERNKRLVARGIVDNKGQTFIHIFTILKLIKENNLKYNVKFLIEGNEETSNPAMADLIEKNKAKLATDYILISDGEITPSTPTIEYSLRGGFNAKLVYTTAKNNMHSGIYGGAVPNPINELSKLLAKIYDAANTVTIAGFYDGVDDITNLQRKDNKKLMLDVQGMLDNTGVKKLVMEKGMDFHTQTGLRPTIQFSGIKGGYIEEGYANIVPAWAEVRFNFRIVTSQTTQKVMSVFEKFVNQNTPKYIDYSLVFDHVHEPVKIDITSKFANETKKLLSTAFGTEALIKPVGGAIPVVGDFKKLLGKDSLLISLGNDDCNMHGVNENFRLESIEKGLRFSKLFFGKV